MPEMIPGLRKPVTFAEKRKIIVIGAGNVGEAIAYTLMVRRQANEIVLIDVNNERAKGAALDIAHGTGFFGQVWVREGDYSECKDAQLIIITAGVGRKPGQTRLDLAKTNMSIIQDVSKNIMKYNENPLILVVSNPADVMTAAVLQETRLRRGQVIGSGTSLDTARFRYRISAQLHLDVADVNAYIVGEHGDSQVALWSDVRIAGIPLTAYEDQVNIHLRRKDIAERVKNGGAEIISGKGATFYGVAMAVSNIAERIMNDQQGILPVAHMMNEKYGDWKDVCFSMPCIVGADGIERTLNIPFTDEERDQMDESVAILRKFQNDLGITSWNKE